MRRHQVGLLVRALFLYFLRRVLSVGPLKSRLVRAVVVIVAVVSSVGAAVLAHIFFARMGLGSTGWQDTARLISFGAVLWAAVAFVFVKVLFSRSTDLLAFTWQLPLTHRERVLALTAYEAGIVLAVTIAFFVPVSTAMIALAGSAGASLLVFGVLVPVLCTYFALAALYHLATRVVLWIRLPRYATVVSVLLAAAVALGLNALQPAWISWVSDDLLSRTPAAHVTDTFVHLLLERGALTATVVACGALALLATAAVLSVPSARPEMFRFVRTWLPAGGRWLRVYLAAMVRRTDYWIIALLAYGTAAVLVAVGNDYYVLAIAILASQAIYAYSGTVAVRSLPGPRQTSRQTIGTLLLAQLVQVAVFSVPVLALAVVAPVPASRVLLAVGAAVSVVVLLTFVGVLFPPYQDNPFSTIVSYAILYGAGIALVLVLGLLQPPTAVTVLVLVLVHAGAIVASVLSLDRLNRSSRYA